MRINLSSAVFVALAICTVSKAESRCGLLGLDLAGCVELQQTYSTDCDKDIKSQGCICDTALATAGCLGGCLDVSGDRLRSALIAADNACKGLACRKDFQEC
ncbi:hypothetical protein EJ02DRAFT_460314 [Clathrospora elynae]|uniref:Extracellular membrane protein CFEM domain-containing protein n=1 Tax=Clathrospora elynae TaxID=706981 RepID=A0A6A5SDK4_9PLEO|nr:hypothetical protein EJ02DRAFT_460314 [Clathrospora elynae]